MLTLSTNVLRTDRCHRTSADSMQQQPDNSTCCLRKRPRRHSYTNLHDGDHPTTADHTSDALTPQSTSSTLIFSIVPASIPATTTTTSPIRTTGENTSGAHQLLPSSPAMWT
nr:unnamed protein product [Spirometra erinaceieuropaei]